MTRFSDAGTGAGDLRFRKPAAVASVVEVDQRVAIRRKQGVPGGEEDIAAAGAGVGERSAEPARAGGDEAQGTGRRLVAINVVHPVDVGRQKGLGA